MKNVLSSYLGMLFSDYPYTLTNFMGVNIGVFATVLYSLAEMRKVRARDRTRAENQSAAEAAEAKTSDNQKTAAICQS
jgi:hypothetical protein